MIHFADWLGHWSVDVYLFSLVLILLALLAAAALRQPVQRITVAKSLLVGLALLAALCSVPGWSVLHLIAAKPTALRTVVESGPPAISPDAPPRHIPVIAHPIPSLQPFVSPIQRTEVVAGTNIGAWALVGAIEFLGGLGVFIWLGSGWAAARTLRRRSQEAPSHIRQFLKEIAQSSSSNNGCAPEVLVSNRIGVPVALGLRHPAIVLPASLIESQSTLAHPQFEMRTILAHELAHIQNGDLHWLAVSRALLILFWSQPLYWLVRRRMRLDQEALADAAAADLTTREQYAEQLVSWARNLSDNRTMRLASAIGLWEGASQLRQRVAILLDERITVLRHFSRKWQLSTLGLCAIIAATLSLMTLRPGQAAAPTEESLNSADAEKMKKAIAVLVETKDIGDEQHTLTIDRHQRTVVTADKWANAIRTLATIGKPAVPELIRSLDAENRDHPISKLAFALRAIGDPRAVPALIRAIPRTLFPERSDYGLNVADPKLLAFMQQHEASPHDGGDDFNYHRAFGEVIGTLHAITKSRQNEKELVFVQLGETELQKESQHQLFQNCAERWARWWSKNWQRFKVGEEYSVVNLPTVARLKPAPSLRALPTGTNLHLGEWDEGWILEAASESKKRCFVDLDTLRQGDWPAKFAALKPGQLAGDAVRAWARSEGYDLIGVQYQPPGYTTPLYCIQPLDLKAWRITPEEQSNLPKSIRGELPYPLGDPVDVLFPRLEKYNGPQRDKLGGTAFLFLTREGTAGLVRMTAQATDTNVKMGAPATPEDQFNSVGFFHGAKISFAVISSMTGKDIGAVSNNANGQVVIDTLGTRGAIGDSADAYAPPRLPPTKPNHLAGKVYDAKKQPVAGVEISVFRVRQSDSSHKLMATLKTDKIGEYHVDNFIDLAKEFPEGKFPPLRGLGDECLQIVARSPGYASQSQLESIQDVAQHGHSMPMVLQPAVTVRGKITDSAGKPVRGALVSIGTGPEFQNWSRANSAQTDDAGNYVIQDASPLDLNKPKTFQDPVIAGVDIVEVPTTLTVSHPGYATKQAVLVKAPGTQDISLERPATIEGSVIYGDSGKPASNVLVQARSEVHGPPVAANGKLPPIIQIASVRTDANGKYKIETLPQGAYDLWAEADHWTNSGLVIHAATGETNHVFDLRLTKGGVISVRLVDADTRKPIPLNKEVTAMIAASPMPYGTAPHTVMQSDVAPTPEGRFELRSPPGKMAVSSLYMDDGTARHWLNRGKPVETDVIEGQTVNVDLPVKDASPAEVTRGVNSPYAAENQPSADRFKSDSPVPAPALSGTASLTTPSPNSPIVPWSIASKSATLTGHVTGPDNKPVSGATVSMIQDPATPVSKRVVAPHTTTNSDGEFKLEGLEPFQLITYYAKIDDQIRRSGDGHILYTPPHTLTVEAPGFATKQIAPQSIPGNQDIQLELPAIIEGRVVFEGNERQTGNVVVQAHGTFTAETQRLYESARYLPVSAEVHTDQAGNYRFTTLPHGSFYVSATTPGWTTNGIPPTESTLEKPVQLPDIIFTKGGIVAVRMIDAKTNKPIELQPEMRALLCESSATRPPAGEGTSDQSAVANAQGRFELRVPAGKRSILAGGLTSPPGGTNWIGHQQIELDVVAGQTIEIDAPLERIEPAPAVSTGSAATSQPETNKDQAEPSKLDESKSLDQRDEALRSNAAETPQPSVTGHVVVENNARFESLDAGAKPATPNTVYGKCVDADGKPITGAEVVIALVTAQDGLRAELGKTQTDADGRFQLNHVIDVAKEFPNGRKNILDSYTMPLLRILARAKGYASASWIIPQSTVAFDGAQVVQTMPTAATIRGHVFDPNGKPIRNAIVSVGQSDFDHLEGFQSARTDADGAYEIDDARPLEKGIDRYTQFPEGNVLTAVHPSYATLIVICPAIPGSQDLHMRPPAIISGRVVNAANGELSANTIVKAATAPNQRLKPGEHSIFQSVSVRTGENGVYRINSLPAGIYDLWAEVPNLVTSEVNGLKTTENTETKSPDISAIPGGKLQIRFVDHDTKKPIELKDKERAQVYLEHSPPLNVPQSLTAIDGKFTLRVIPGENRIMTAVVADQKGPTWIGHFPVSISVTAGNMQDVDVPVENISAITRKK